MKALEELKEYIESENRLGDLDYAHYSNIIDYINEAIEELEAVTNRSCEGCKHYDSTESIECILCVRNCDDNYEKENR